MDLAGVHCLGVVGNHGGFPCLITKRGVIDKFVRNLDNQVWKDWKDVILLRRRETLLYIGR
jgi:hypothetical protein